MLHSGDSDSTGAIAGNMMGLIDPLATLQHRWAPVIEGADIITRMALDYLPMRRGFLYLVAIMDWFTRKVLAWRISNTLEADFCVEALNEAIHKFGPPEIMNTDSHTIDASSRVV